ncbi:MAG: hypothetical protein ABSE95_14970 [Thermodesulfobacteriota bacterium]|jgi:hypothetical protein
MELMELVKVLNDINHASLNHRFEAGESIIYEFKSREEVENKLGACGIKFEKNGKNEVSININNYQGLFYNADHFLQESELYFRQDCNKESITSNIGILFYSNDESLFYDSMKDFSYLLGRDQHVPKDFLIPNTFYYWKIVQYLQSLDIIEYHSVANREFILVTPEKGKFILGYPAIPPIFPRGSDLRKKYIAIKEINPSREFRYFLKAQIIDSLSMIREHDQRLIHLIENIETVIEATNNNYEVFLRKFNFEELKKNFRKERDQYFVNIRDLVNQLLSKVVAIPISVSASALAIYNLKKEPIYATIVAIAFILYSVFASYLLRLLHMDSDELKQDLTKDIRIIKESSNIPKEILNSETSKVYKKINTLKITISLLQIILALLSASVLFIFLQFMTWESKWVILLLIIIFDLQLSIAFFNLQEKKRSSKS